MIDNRIVKKLINQAEPILEHLSDTDIMINFQQSLCKLYPYLIPVCSFCYDSWDNIVENLYDEMVLETLCWKYGLKFNKDYFHRYAFEINRKNHYIECFIKEEKVSIMYESGISEVKQNTYFMDKKIVFKEFSDGEHNLTGSITQDEARNVRFNLISAFLIDSTDESYRNIFIDANDIFFELVLNDNISVHSST